MAPARLPVTGFAIDQPQVAPGHRCSAASRAEFNRRGLSCPAAVGAGAVACGRAARSQGRRARCISPMPNRAAFLCEGRSGVSSALFPGHDRRRVHGHQWKRLRTRRDGPPDLAPPGGGAWSASGACEHRAHFGRDPRPTAAFATGLTTPDIVTFPRQYEAGWRAGRGRMWPMRASRHGLFPQYRNEGLMVGGGQKKKIRLHNFSRGPISYYHGTMEAYFAAKIAAVFTEVGPFPGRPGGDLGTGGEPSEWTARAPSPRHRRSGLDVRTVGRTGHASCA